MPVSSVFLNVGQNTPLRRFQRRRYADRGRLDGDIDRSSIELRVELRGKDGGVQQRIEPAPSRSDLVGHCIELASFVNVERLGDLRTHASSARGSTKGAASSLGLLMAKSAPRP